MKNECLISKVLVALGGCLLLLSMGVFVDQANAGICACVDLCTMRMPVSEGGAGCALGQCQSDLVWGLNCKDAAGISCGCVATVFPPPVANICRCL